MDWQIIDQQGEAAAITEEQLRGMLRLGHLKRSTLMWGEGMTDWLPAETVRPDLFPALHKHVIPLPSGPPPVVVVPPQQTMTAPARGRRVRKVAPAKSSG